MKLLTALFLVMSASLLFAQSKSSDSFRLLSVERNPKEPGWPIGIFSFTNRTNHEQQVYAFDSPSDGEFHARFVKFQVMSGKKWEKYFVGYCGTGAQLFILEPGKTYKIRAELFPFIKDTPVGKVGLALGGKDPIWSEPFDYRTFK